MGADSKDGRRAGKGGRKPAGPLSVSCCGKAALTKAAASRLRSLAPVFKALADAHRLEMVGMLLLADRPLCVCEFEERFRLSQPTISHHLKVLREAGVVRSTRLASWVYYELEAKSRGPLAAVRGLLEG